MRLEPLSVENHVQRLFDISNGSPIFWNNRHYDGYDAEAMIWKFLLDEKPETVSEMRQILEGRQSKDRALCFCVIDQQTNLPVGMCNYMNNYPEHLKIELGGIWYSPIVQGTGINTEVIYLLLKHAFSLGYLRVEWKCDALHSKSRHVAEKLGFTFECIQKSHMISKGFSRDTAWFSMISEHWLEIEKTLYA